MEGEENKKINIMTNGKKWSENDKKKLIQLYQLGYKFYEIAVKMDRSRFAVQSEMRLLHLLGRVGYRTIESEAAANKRWLSFTPKPVTRPSDEGAEQAERALVSWPVRVNGCDVSLMYMKQLEGSQVKL